MQILAFTDNHGDLRAYDKIRDKVSKADIILCGGDFTIFEHDWEAHAKAINNLGKQVLLIHGNHESESLCRKIDLKYKNIHFLHDKVYKVKDMVFYGWGGGGFSEHDFEFEAAAKKKLKHFKDQFILITHAPPHGTELDVIHGGQHVGCRSITDFIEKHQPRLALSGHLHENFKKAQKLGKSIVMNPGPKGTVIKINPK